MRRDKKVKKMVIPRKGLQSLLLYHGLSVDVPNATLTATQAELASDVGIAWLPGTTATRAERRAYRHAIERACTRHLVPRSGKAGVKWAVKWTWVKPDGSRAAGGAL